MGTGDAVIDVGRFVLWVRAVLSLTWGGLCCGYGRCCHWAVCVVVRAVMSVKWGDLCVVGTDGGVSDIGRFACCRYGRCCQ